MVTRAFTRAFAGAIAGAFVRYVTLILIVAGILIIAGSIYAQKEKSKPLPRTEIAKRSPKLFIGKVTQVDVKANVITMQDKDNEKVTINFSDSKIGTCAAGRKAKAWMVNNVAVGDVVMAKYILTIEKDGRYSSCQECIETCCGQCVSGPGGRCFCFENIPTRKSQDCNDACRREHGANSSAIAECEARCRELLK